MKVKLKIDYDIVNYFYKFFQTLIQALIPCEKPK